MITTKEIMDMELKDGREYLYIGGERYRPGDCFLNNVGREVSVKSILDAAHFMDSGGQCWHTYMFYDYKCEHCLERNADKKTQDRTPAAKVFDMVEKERDAFKMNIIQTYKAHQAYAEYGRIYFYENMHRYFSECSREPSTELSETLLKIGDNILGQMYGKYLEKRPDLSSKPRIESFLKGFLNEPQVY